MFFADFIKNTLSGNNAIHWNYYNMDGRDLDVFNANSSINFIKDYFAHGEKNFPLILNSERANHFIKEYFTAGSKSMVLNLEFNQKLQLPEERAIHTVSGFFLGLLIENSINKNNTLSIERPDYFPFSYLWFLAYLYHDYSYCVTEREESILKVPLNVQYPENNPFKVIAEYGPLKNVKHQLEISMTPFSSCCRPLHSDRFSSADIPLEQKLLRELARKLYVLKRFSDIRFNNGTKISGNRYNSITVTRYFNYRMANFNVADHGIVGGFLFFDRMIKNYMYAYMAELQSNPETKLTNFYHNDRRFCEKQLPVFSYIADCIISHNIWRQQEKYKHQYELFKLDDVLGDNFKVISYEENPLLYILSIADTLEPTKVYNELSPNIVADAINIKYTPGKRIINFSSANPEVNIDKLYERAKGLEDWTTLTVSVLKSGKFSIRL